MAVTISISLDVTEEMSLSVSRWRANASTPTSVPNAAALSGNINASVTTVGVVDATLVPINRDIMIDNEVMRVTAKAGNNLTVTRGMYGTVAASHSTGAVVHVLAGANPIVALKALFRQAMLSSILSQYPTTAIQAERDAITTAENNIKTITDAAVV